MIARVLPDLPAVERIFDYLVPDTVRDQVRVGTLVRVELQGRRVRGWVVELADEVADGVAIERLKPLAKVSSAGPPPEVVDLARWAAWRWGGRWVHLLRTASPPANVVPPRPANPEARGGGYRPLVPREPGSGDVEVVRLPPAADRWPLVLEAVAAGPAIVVVPGVATAERMAARLRRDGHRIACLAGPGSPSDFAMAATGSASVVGTRIAVWAPVPDAALTSITVLDEHDESLQSEQAPTWHARDVAIERAGLGARGVVPAGLGGAHDARTGRRAAHGTAGGRDGWPAVLVADRRDEDPVKAGLFSPALARALREPGRVVCVLNRLGRSRLLACTACGQVADCERCGAAVAQPEPGVLRCGHCGIERPLVCAACGGGRFKNLRAGVTRAREELEALAGEPVVEVTATEGDPATARIAIGTEAVLHRLPAASVAVVAFLDFDQELLAPRYRAAEQALALLARAGRSLGGRRRGSGRLLLQTRLPEHAVVQAALHGDPSRVADAERARREQLRYPPFAALALVSGAGAPAWAEAALATATLGVEVLGSGDDRWLVRAAHPGALADFLALVARPAARTRIEVDPPRL